MTTKHPRAFSLIEVLLSLTALAIIIIPLINLETRILFSAKRFHEKLIRIMPLANSLNNISLLTDLKTSIEKNNIGPDTKILIKLEKVAENSDLFKFKNLEKIIATQSWDKKEENLIKYIFILKEQDEKSNNKQDNKEKK
jgi:prepilin-type N-terminal cleavage/methylation domain-containing protein